MIEQTEIPKKGQWMVCGTTLFQVGMRTRLKNSDGEMVDVILRDSDDPDKSNTFKLSECVPADKQGLLALERFTFSFEGKTCEAVAITDGLILDFGGFTHEIRFLTPDELAVKGARDLARMFSGWMVSEDVEVA